MLTSIRNRKGVSTARHDDCESATCPVDDNERGFFKKDKVKYLQVIAVRLVVCLAFVLVVVVRSGFDYKKAVKSSVHNFWVYWEDNGYLPLREPFQLDMAEDYPELATLSEHYPEILAELQALLDKHEKDILFLRETSSKLKGDVYKVEWKTFWIKLGEFIPENAAMVPKLTALLEKIPGIQTAMFSILNPKTYLEPHYGIYKGIMTYHLALKIPDGDKCVIRLHPDVKRDPNRSQADLLKEIDNSRSIEYHWKAGEAVLFDDTILHDANNQSDEVRVVLFISIARKMPWYLAIINEFFLFVALHEGQTAEMRKNAVLKPRAN